MAILYPSEASVSSSRPALCWEHRVLPLNQPGIEASIHLKCKGPQRRSCNKPNYPDYNKIALIVVRTFFFKKFLLLFHYSCMPVGGNADSLEHSLTSNLKPSATPQTNIRSFLVSSPRKAVASRGSKQGHQNLNPGA